MAEQVDPIPPDGFVVRQVQPISISAGTPLPEGVEIVHTEVIHYVRLADGATVPARVLDVPNSVMLPAADAAHSSSYVEVETDDEASRRLTPPVIAALAFALLALLSFGLYARSRAEGEAVTAVFDALGDSRVADDFQRDAPQPLQGSAPGGTQWSSLGPGFEAADGQATVVDSPDGEVTLAIVDPGWPDQSSGVTVEQPAVGAGFVFRFVDIYYYWSLIAAPDFGTWNLVLTVDGLPSLTEPTGLSFTGATTRLSLVTEGPSIRVFVDGLPVLTVTDPTFERASATGLIATSGTDASFSEIFVIEKSAAAPNE